MGKLLPLIFLQLYAVSFLVAANETISWRHIDGYHQKKPDEQTLSSEEYHLDKEYLGKEVDGKSGEPIGRWWNNGQALEPKWRDGDHVPRAPLPAPAPKVIDDVEDVPTFQSRHKEPRLSRRRKPPQLPEDEQREKPGNQSSSSNKQPRFSYERTESSEGAAMKYRETFQNQPSEYDLNDEEYQKPRPRKRRPPQNHEFAEVRSSYVVHQTERAQENSELKTLLKEQRGKDLSLSEILQRSNLSLSDLLQGKANVIDLLKMSHREDYVDEEQPKWKQMTSQSYQQGVGSLLKNVDGLETKESSMIPAKEVEASTSQKVPTISETPIEVTTTVKNVDTDFPDVLQVDESKKKTDPGAIDNLDEDEIMEFSDFTTKNGEIIAEDTEHVSSTEKNPKEVIPDDLESDKISDIPNETEQFDSLELEYQNDAPEEEEAGKKDAKRKTLGNIVEEVMKMQEKNASDYESILSRVEPEARAEILGLFSTGSSAKRLERLLKSRNMSVDELIALRQRGSSQVHLAEVWEQRRKKMLENVAGKPGASANWEKKIEKKDEIENVKDNFADEQKLEIQETRFRLPKKLNFEEELEKPREIFDIYTAFDSLPIARDIKEEFRKISDDLMDENNGTMSFVEVGRVEEILDKNAGSSYDKVYDSEETEVEVEHKTLDRVRPSIIASGAILGVALVVFLAIFIVCRIQQRQRYTYRNTFSRAVFQNPAIAARKLSNTSSLNTIMVNIVAAKSNRLNEFGVKGDIENDSLDGNDSWDTIPDFMK